ncbi:alpha/beta fold hydrolase [Niallia endozanthoxylica]|uniref:Alpha/beta hydrolase n=1 Tax=Niallia endozanthoxylica TaxID=2036016 RepID=A0A5J5H1S6_9BACI|nr:alpha/beta hydrolase [Niallia endozanthoxylica]KAA9014519.1 alpha/beta hydrolase [Niallia endozanthoxylica]
MLVYDDIGDGIPLVLIHGLGSRKEAWKPQYELAANYRLIIPDLRGHGETSLNDNISIYNFAKDIENLLDFLQIPSAFICGLSLGGIVAQELYKQRPDIVKGLVLSNTISYIPSLLALHTLTNASRQLKRDRQGLIEQIARTSVYDQSFKAEAMDAFQIHDTYLAAARAPIGMNYFPILPTIKKPVLLIGSTHDRVTPYANIYLMKPYIRNVRTALLWKTGHLSNIERKECFNQQLKNFIEANVS